METSRPKKEKSPRVHLDEDHVRVKISLDSSDEKEKPNKRIVNHDQDKENVAPVERKR